MKPPQLALAALVLAGIAVFGWHRSGAGDFAFFHETARVWLATGTYTAGDNLNLPAFTLLLLPVAWMPVFPAWVAWQTAQGLCLLWLLVRSRLPEPVAFAALATPAVLVQITFAQTAAALAVLVVLAYEADRRDDETRAGVWLGIAMALKPFLLPVLLWWIVGRRSRAAVTAAGAAATVSVLGLALIGPESYRSWHVAVLSIDQHVLEANTSLWGTVQAFDRALEIWLALAVIVAGLTAWAAWRRSDPAAWVLVLAACLLLSPLGWVYYQVFLIVPLAMVAKQSKMVAGAVLALWMPVAAGAGCVPLLLVWSATLLEARTRRQAAGARSLVSPMSSS